MSIWAKSFAKGDRVIQFYRNKEEVSSTVMDILKWMDESSKMVILTDDNITFQKGSGKAGF